MFTKLYSNLKGLKGSKGNILKYGLYILLILTFLAGIYFIYWMGNNNTLTSLDTSTSISMSPSDTSISMSPSDTSISMSPSDNNMNDLISTTNDDLCPNLLIKRGTKLMLFNKNMPEIPKQNPLFFDSLEQYIEYIKVQREMYNQHCPVLYLQEETNSQGEDVYRLRKPDNSDIMVDPLLTGSSNDYFQNKTNVTPEFKPPSGPTAFNKPTQNSSVNLALYNNPNTEIIPTNIQTVPYVDSNRDNKPFNQGINGFDPTSQYVGKYTVLDQIHDSTQIQNKEGVSDNAMDTNWGGAVFTTNQIKVGKYADE